MDHGCRGSDPRISKPAFLYSRKAGKRNSPFATLTGHSISEAETKLRLQLTMQIALAGNQAEGRCGVTSKVE